MDHYFTNNQNLKSEIKEINYTYNGYNFLFMSDNGVFSKNKIDYGSKLLVETYLKNKKSVPKNILDIGCGYGFIGLTLSKILANDVTLIDINKRALHLARRNAQNNNINANIIESDAYQNVSDKYDVIISNPPVRVGKEILLSILIGAKDYLTENGELWYVLRKDQGCKSIAKTLSDFYRVEIVEKSNGFYIFLCKKY